MAIATSFSESVAHILTPYATSNFGHHSMLSTVSVIGCVLNAVFQPPVAKFADVFGRKEGFLLSLVLYCLGHLLAAVSNDIKVFAAARVFDAAGATGLKMMQQVFIADSSNLLNRMLVGSIPDFPFLATVWAGPPVAERLRLMSDEGWRWGYGIW
jgi:MFS family permease